MSVKITKFGDPFKAAQETIEKGNLKIASKVTAQTKVLAPVAPEFGGTLRNSYMYKAGKKGGEVEGGFNSEGGTQAEKKLSGSPAENEAYVGSNLDYSVYQEFGTRKMAPQPHLRPAIALVAKGQSATSVLAKIAKEEMLGALKKGQKRVKF